MWIRIKASHVKDFWYAAYIGKELEARVDEDCFPGVYIVHQKGEDRLVFKEDAEPTGKPTAAKRATEIIAECEENPVLIHNAFVRLLNTIDELKNTFVPQEK